MKVTIEMDCLTLTMKREDTAPKWTATIVSTVNPDKGTQTATLELDDRQAAATAALACGGIDGEEDPQTERRLYEMTGGAWDKIDLDLRPIP